MSIRELGKEYETYIIEQRRYFHQNPELAFDEVESTRHIKNELEKMGIEVKTFDDITGVIGDLKGGKPGPAVLIRADMDALPVAEETGLPFASTNGSMHACGHDGHMASALGAAKILSSMREELQGTVRFVFEPAEESCYGGPVTKTGEKTAYGSCYMIERGALEDVSAVFGLHIWADLPAGKISVESGVRMAANDSFTIRIHGQSAHGSAPQNGRDANLCAASVMLNLQTLVSRVNDPRNMLVMTIGKMTGGTIFNTVSNEAFLEGTVRTFSKSFRERIEPEMKKIIDCTAEALGCTAEFYYRGYCSVIENVSEELNMAARESAKAVFGEDNIMPMPAVTASESYSAYMDRAPAHFAFVGAKDEENGMVFANHNVQFTIHEETLGLASAYLAQCAFEYLEKHS
ncbi:amidohydrolase [Lachnospiraceae bacterium 62-35]